MIPQQAASTITSIDDIETYLRSRETDKKKYRQAIDLPVRERKRVIRDLSYMGNTTGSLFPRLGWDLRGTEGTELRILVVEPIMRPQIQIPMSPFLMEGPIPALTGFQRGDVLTSSRPLVGNKALFPLGAFLGTWDGSSRIENLRMRKTRFKTG